MAMVRPRAVMAQQGRFSPRWGHTEKVRPSMRENSQASATRDSARGWSLHRRTMPTTSTSIHKMPTMASRPHKIHTRSWVRDTPGTEMEMETGISTERAMARRLSTREMITRLRRAFSPF